MTCLKESDLVINCILWPKHRKDHLIYREDLKLMKKRVPMIPFERLLRVGTTG